jgi:hypothetical protein
MAIIDDQQTIRTLTDVVDRSVAAPSVHNTQPLRFAVSSQRLTISADRRRQLHALDPTGRQLVISCGCALFNARIAAAKRGVAVRVTRFPDGPDSPVLAHLDVCAPDDPRRDRPVPDADIEGLYAAIATRQTNRRHFSDQPVPAALLAVLRRGAEHEQAIALEIRTDEDRLTVVRLSQRADALQYADPAYRSELRAWTTDDPSRRDGVPAMAVPHVDAGSGDEIPIRDFDARGTGFLPTATGSTRNQCLILLGTEGDNPQSWLATGEALERMLLEIARAGLAASPLTQVVEVPSERAALRAELRLTMVPHILLRVGYAPATPRSSRRAVEDVLEQGVPG